MKRRGFLQSLAAIGIGVPLAKVLPAQAEEEVICLPSRLHHSNNVVGFVIRGKDLMSHINLKNQIDNYEHNLHKVLIKEGTPIKLHKKKWNLQNLNLRLEN